jgi:hypothetical protein
VEASVRGGDGVWGPLRTLSAADENAAYPSVAIDGDGTVTAVWLRVDDGLVRVRAATARDGAWSAPQDISAAVASRTGYPPAPPQVAAGPGGRAAAIWTLAGRGGEGAVQTAILVPGAGWEAPAMLAPRQRRPREPRVAIDGAGTALAAWDDDDGAVRVAARPVGAPWEQPVVVSRAPGRACGASLHPRLAAGAAGEAVVAWHELTPRGNVLQVAERVGGAWSTPRDLSLPGGQLPSLAIAANGEGLAVWAAVQGRRERALVQSSRRPVVALPPDSGLPQPPHPALSGLRLLGASAAGVRVSFRLTRAARLRVSNEPLDGQRGLLLIREQAARGGVNRLLLRPMTGRLAPGRYRLTLHAEQGTRTSCSASLTYLVLGRIAPT